MLHLTFSYKVLKLFKIIVHMRRLFVHKIHITNLYFRSSLEAMMASFGVVIDSNEPQSPKKRRLPSSEICSGELIDRSIS